MILVVHEKKLDLPLNHVIWRYKDDSLFGKKVMKFFHYFKTNIAHNPMLISPHFRYDLTTKIKKTYSNLYGLGV